MISHTGLVAYAAHSIVTGPTITPETAVIILQTQTPSCQ